MVQAITLEALFSNNHDTTHTLIDVRSPKEFHEATIPGSINIPVFDNDERAEVGTLYKQVGQEAAKQRGLEIFSQKLPEFIASFQEMNTPMTIFCWRGGMRSKTAVTVLELMGIHANRLQGGIRSYRHWVMEELDKQAFSPRLCVLNGYTGTGKTILLKKIAALGYPVIDLEQMAGHRGSIFGQIGLEPSKQKEFDARLVTAMHQYEKEPFVFVEGESKRIGKVQLPDFFFKKKEEGLQLFIDLPLEERVTVILNEYEPWKNPEQFKEAFGIIKKRIHIPIAKEIENCLEFADYSTAVRLLLEYYYDPRYQHTNDQYTQDQSVKVQASNPDEALDQVLTFIQEKFA